MKELLEIQETVEALLKRATNLETELAIVKKELAINQHTYNRLYQELRAGQQKLFR